MMRKLATLIEDNGLALVSLLVALTALGYNTWRNEATESNRNIRAAGFEVLREAAHLQLLVDRAYYAPEEEKPDPIEGWARVNLILALSDVMPEETQAVAQNLKTVWGAQWQTVYRMEDANVKITDANVQLQKEVQDILKALD